MSQHRADQGIPVALRATVEEIRALTDEFCHAHLDAEYAKLCRRVVRKLARKRPSPLARGAARNWAGGAIYTIGSVNFLFDRSQTPHLTGDDLSRLLGIPKSTLANKAKTIRDTLQIGMIEPEFSRRELLVSSALPWLIQVNGLIVDARTAPPEIQAEALRKGLIPDLAALDADDA